MTNGTQLQTSTNGQGDVGSVNINAHNTVSFHEVDSNEFFRAAFSDVASGAVGKGGSINITAESFFSLLPTPVDRGLQRG